jgi:DNA phosphorothioation-associated putative methyltransferase
MDGSAFAREVARLTLGKRMPDGVYVHVEALAVLPEEIRAAVDAARALAQLDASAFQVINLALRGSKLSFLAYPRFFEEAFPTLTASWVVDLGAGTVTSRAYAAEGNPPILHRKELLLPADHTLRGELAALTAEAERLGLFAESQAIGTRRPWEARLARLGLRVEGHRLVETGPSAGGDASSKAGVVVEEAAAGPVLRHRTALQRYSLSTPMQAL